MDEMNYFRSQTYIDDLRTTWDQIGSRDKLRGQSVLITGAAGLVGGFLTDVLLWANREKNMDITIYASARNMESLQKRFPYATEESCLNFLVFDACKDNLPEQIFDYIIHAASNAAPGAFAEDPVGTMLANILGCKTILDYGKDHSCKKIVYVSSGEIYGQMPGTVKSFSEKDSGYVDSMEVRSCYPNGKRAAETLCVAYNRQFQVPVTVARLCHTYGATTTKKDNRATNQFLNLALAGKDIILKSAGNQMRSYCYIADSVSGLLTVLLNGNSGEAYNIANPEAVITVGGFAKAVAKLTGRQVRYEIANESDQTPITYAVLNTEKLSDLGWSGSYTIEKGIRHMIATRKEIL